ncbi:hypothetical protein [Comamonas fluminis]|uniref:hypothetical protein n=1 Tax=Comamonas fluminis TaxID=2796366 RepID=UPI001C438F2A|nr:hypothetical protein [Comamonas fluminis]
MSAIAQFDLHVAEQKQVFVDVLSINDEMMKTESYAHQFAVQFLERFRQLVNTACSGMAVQAMLSTALSTPVILRPEQGRPSRFLDKRLEPGAG